MSERAPMQEITVNSSTRRDQLALELRTALSPVPSFSPRLMALQPTPVFDEFWRFADERQRIFCNRQTRTLPPWTTDPILSSFKFTNVYRASDRVSQFLIREVIYSGDDDPGEVIFRVLLFKLFNKIETWQLLERELGPVTTARFSVEKFAFVLNKAFESGDRIYSGAYIMPAGAKAFKSTRKHEAHLQLLDFMLKDKLSEKIISAKSLKEVFQILRSYPLIGDFLAFQYAIDINYSEATKFSESEFVAAGPGAKSGLCKCFANLAELSHEDVIRLVTELQEEEFSRRGIEFRWLGGRRLQLIDIQNVFCEIDKYARVRFPDTVGLANRAKIKQRFKPNPAPVSHWYPPKWGINDHL
jgi:hypothetical protein